MYIYIYIYIYVYTYNYIVVPRAERPNVGTQYSVETRLNLLRKTFP